MNKLVLIPVVVLAAVIGFSCLPADRGNLSGSVQAQDLPAGEAESAGGYQAGSSGMHTGCAEAWIHDQDKPAVDPGDYPSIEANVLPEKAPNGSYYLNVNDKPHNSSPR
jgi:hypothetical protein